MQVQTQTHNKTFSILSILQLHMMINNLPLAGRVWCGGTCLLLALDLLCSSLSRSDKMIVAVSRVVINKELKQAAVS